VATAPEPLDPSFTITLPAFEGPLDLLLHLIKAHELDILDLPIAFVTERYLSYVSLMEKLDLDIASEYLVMAATLAHIKSKMLLPQEPAGQEEEEEAEELDPRAELIRRLLEYQKYKLAAEQLGSRGIAGRDVFARGSEAPEASGPAPLSGVGLFALLDAFNAVLARARADLAFQITAEGVSIQDRMRQVTELLGQRRDMTFHELFEGQASIYELVVTFLALLEMAKRRLVRIYQADPSSPIHLRSTVLAVDAPQQEEGANEAGATPHDDVANEAGEAPVSADPAAAAGEHRAGEATAASADEADERGAVEARPEDHGVEEARAEEASPEVEAARAEEPSQHGVDEVSAESSGADERGVDGASAEEAASADEHGADAGTVEAVVQDRGVEERGVEEQGVQDQSGDDEDTIIETQAELERRATPAEPSAPLEDGDETVESDGPTAQHKIPADEGA
jgi:segregation and condensation protein A